MSMGDARNGRDDMSKEDLSEDDLSDGDVSSEGGDDYDDMSDGQDGRPSRGRASGRDQERRAAGNGGAMEEKDVNMVDAPAAGRAVTPPRKLYNDMRFAPAAPLPFRESPEKTRAVK